MHSEYDTIDLIRMKLLAQLSLGQRLQTMLAARELAVSLKRGRIHRQFSKLSIRNLNLKLLDELARAQRTDSRYYPAGKATGDCVAPESLQI